jgi:ribonuclease J
VRVRIHRGTREIGGTCIELESAGSRILLDLGLPLDAKDLASTPLPKIEGLADGSSTLLAIILSHGHRDHWGLIPKVNTQIPLVMGKATESIVRAAADFVPDAVKLNATHYLEHGKPIQLGPFTILPRLVDHSGFDAYAIEVEANGKRLFYSGDLRAHGRKGSLFEALITNPPRDIDTMLMEGSSLGRLADDQSFPSEVALEETFVDRFKATAGMALVACSAQNIDRVVTVYRAAKRTGRTLIVDAYAAEVLKATGQDSIPKPCARMVESGGVYPPQSAHPAGEEKYRPARRKLSRISFMARTACRTCGALGHAFPRLDDEGSRTSEGVDRRSCILVAMGRLSSCPR